MPPITFPVSNLVRWGIYVSSAAYTALEQLGYLSLFDEDELQLQEDIEWRHLQLVWTRQTPTGTQEDVAVWGLDLANFTSGEVDATWTGGDYAAVETAFITWWTAVKSRVASNHTFSQFRFYRRKFPLSVAMGPPDHIGNYNNPGTGTASNCLPYQVALSVTEITNIPRSWGRFYQPGLTDTQLDAYGRWNSADIDVWADATEALYETLITGQFVPVVPHGGSGTLLPVHSIQIDDIPDVQRRRRPKTTLIRDTRSLV